MVYPPNFHVLKTFFSTLDPSHSRTFQFHLYDVILESQIHQYQSFATVGHLGIVFFSDLVIHSLVWDDKYETET